MAKEHTYRFRPFAPSTAGYGARLRQAREAAGYSIADACMLTNSTPELWRRHEAAKSLADGAGCLGEPWMIVAAQLFGVTLDWLAYGDKGLAQIGRVVKRRKQVA